MRRRKLLDDKTVSPFDLGLLRLQKTLPVFRVKYDDPNDTWRYVAIVLVIGVLVSSVTSARPAFRRLARHTRP